MSATNCEKVHRCPAKSSTLISTFLTLELSFPVIDPFNWVYEIDGYILQDSLERGPGSDCPECTVMVRVEVVDDDVPVRSERKYPMGVRIVAGPFDQSRAVGIAGFDEICPVLNHLVGEVLL
jgi:hypothetical protein